MNFIEQIAEVLRDAKKEMHVDAIAEAIVEKYPHTRIPLDELSKKVSSSLAKDIAKKKVKSDFVKPKNSKGAPRRGMYRIKIKRVTPEIVPPPPIVNALYTGKAGEFAVMSELLFFGFNTSFMTVDDGIDIVATKDNKYFHIQVKTANISESNNQYKFTINQRSYDSKDASSTFYIFVLRSASGPSFVNNYIILPNSDISRLIESGIITQGNKLSIRIEKDTTGKYLLNSKEDVKYALNRFDKIH